jgi:cytochrome c oxidase subunit IV
MSDGHAESIQKQVRGYVVIFIALAGLTAITVAASYLPVSRPMHVTIALVIALVKAALVAAYFMHLISERKAIYALLILTAAFFVVLIFLPLGDHLNPITMR